MGKNGVEELEKPKLYSFYLSSCSCRVRIALNLKGIDYEYKAVNCFKKEHLDPVDYGHRPSCDNHTRFSYCLANDHSSEAWFLKLNPIGYVPVLVDGDITIADSFAIIMYLEEKYPQHQLLPNNIEKRALNYQAANIVASSIQPLQNFGVRKYMDEKVGLGEILPWIQSHIRKGFTALEKLLSKYAGKYATGDEVYLADVFLAPQIHGSIKRFQIDMTEYPILSRLNEAYQELPAFQNAMPEKQPDAPVESI